MADRHGHGARASGRGISRRGPAAPFGGLARDALGDRLPPAGDTRRGGGDPRRELRPDDIHARFAAAHRRAGSQRGPRSAHPVRNDMGVPRVLRSAKPRRPAARAQPGRRGAGDGWGPGGRAPRRGRAPRPLLRLQKVLADRGVASRRAAERLMREGRVAVDGEIIRELGTRVAPDARIQVDGQAVAPAPRHRYVLLNKPPGVVSTAHDERGRRTVIDLLGARDRLYPVGRLDADSEGLLVLTNDGVWAERVLHPRYGHEREYEVVVAGVANETALAALRRGIALEEGVARATRVALASRGGRGSVLRMALRTGGKRQVGPTGAAVGLKVTRVRRIRMGPLLLGRLRPGAWRELTSAEVRALGGA